MPGRPYVLFEANYQQLREYRPVVAVLPDDKLLSGRRDLTFVLVSADGTQLANREARATVYGVVLAGRR